MSPWSCAPLCQAGIRTLFIYLFLIYLIWVLIPNKIVVFSNWQDKALAIFKERGSFDLI